MATSPDRPDRCCTRRAFIRLGAAGAVAISPLARAIAQASQANRPPNIVLIFTDDQGYGDLSSYGHEKIRTPRIDQMAREGMKFTDFYVAAPVCTPSRAALLTGSYPARVGLASGVVFPPDKWGLNPDEITIAELLKQRGYATACIGKWHLGHQPELLPTNQGFDTYFGIPYSNDMGKKRQGGKFPALPLMRDDKTIETEPDQGLLTERYTDEALKFIRQHKDQPFFLYLPHTMPHVPIFASERFRGKSEGGLYGDVIETIDWSTGAILDELRKLGLDENTLVIFTSDNGPWLSKGAHGGTAGKLRGGKATTWEGGLRVPCVMRWPGTIPAGSTCHELATTMDLLPTLCAFAGAKPPQDRRIDGRSIVPLLRGEPDARTPHEAFFYHTSGGHLEAVRSGPWKLHIAKRKSWAEKNPPEGFPKLYNLSEDIGEREDVAAGHPQVVERLKALIEAHQRDIAAHHRPAANRP